jgi:hypothetical protein
MIPDYIYITHVNDRTNPLTNNLRRYTMDNMNYMMKAINKDAVFAQLDIVTTGTCHNEGIELFRTNSKGEKIGEWNCVLDFEDLCNIAKDLMKERESYDLSKEECGEYAGFYIKVIFDGGLRTHFEISADGQVSEEYAEWRGHNPLEALD